MLGYRIKQTAFILAGLVVFFLSIDRFALAVGGRYQHAGGRTLSEFVWFAVCLMGGEGIAQVTGGKDDAKRERA